MNSTGILTKREKGNLQIWLSQSLLMQYCPTLTDGYLRVIRCWQKQGRITQWQWQQTNGTYYYNIDTIPNKKPAMYASMIPSREELIAMQAEPQAESEALLVEHAKVFVTKEYYKYLHYYNSTCTEQQAINLARACAMLEWMIGYIDEASIDLGSLDFFKQSCEIIAALEIKYLPDTAYRNLKYKVLEILGGNTSIIENVYLPRANNDYAALHREDKEVLSWLYELRESGANYTNAYIIRKIQAECEKLSKPVPSERWIGEKLNERETKFLTASTRYGLSGKYGNPYKASIPTATALFAGDCWEMDATRVNVIPHKDSDKKLQYLTIIAVRDVHSGNVLGTSFDISENRWSVTQALSNAVANAGYLPYEIRYDRFPGHNTEEVEELFKTLEYLGVKMTKVFKSTGKQRLERWFGSMQHLALQESPFYYGEGIMSNRKTAHRSKEYMQMAKQVAKQCGWDFDKAVNETSAKINSWLNTPYSKWSRKYKHIELSPVQMHEQSEKPNVRSCDEAQHAFLFGLKKTLKIRNNGLIHTTINHEDFIYQITDFEVIKTYDSVICCYDVEDLSKVHLYAPTNTPMKIYLGIANEYIPVQLYGTNPEYGRLAKVKALYSEFELMKQRDLEEAKKKGKNIKKVANGGWEFGADYTVAQPMITYKANAEAAESEVTNKHFGFDTGEDLNIDILNQL